MAQANSIGGSGKQPSLKQQHPLEYRSWTAMRNRCISPKNASWKYYGAKGVTVCDRWQSFEAFFQDIGPKPSPEHSIDRFPNTEGNYEPGNCRWASKREQVLTRSITRLIEFDGKKQCLADWSRETGIPESTIVNRIDAGCSMEDVFAHGPGQGKVRIIEYKGRSMSVSAWARLTGIPAATIHERPSNDALTLVRRTTLDRVTLFD